MERWDTASPVGPLAGATFVDVVTVERWATASPVGPLAGPRLLTSLLWKGGTRLKDELKSLDACAAWALVFAGAVYRVEVGQAHGHWCV